MAQKIDYVNYRDSLKGYTCDVMDDSVSIANHIKWLENIDTSLFFNIDQYFKDLGWMHYKNYCIFKDTIELVKAIDYTNLTLKYKPHDHLSLWNLAIFHYFNKDCVGYKDAVEKLRKLKKFNRSEKRDLKNMRKCPHK